MVAGSYPTIGPLQSEPCRVSDAGHGRWVGLSGDFGVGFDFVAAAELLVPPVGLATLQRTLRLRDVRGQLLLLCAKLFLELGERLLASLELVEADLVIGVVPRLALVEILFALVLLAGAASQDGLVFGGA